MSQSIISLVIIVLLVVVLASSIKIIHQQNRGPLVALSSCALLHRITNRGRRFNGPQLDPVDFDTPLAGGFVKNRPELLVDLLTASQGRFHIHATDDVA